MTTYYRTAEHAEKATAILALYILHRRVSSSLRAGLNSLKKRKDRLLEPYAEIEANRERDYLDNLDQIDEANKENVENVLLGSTASTGEDFTMELEALEYVIDVGQKISDNEIDSKFKKLLELVLNLIRTQSQDKIIIFTEFRDTLFFLEEHLKKAGLSISKIHGDMSNEEKKEQQDAFASTSQILLGTDAAGEGLNLQFANIVINYELPWNPNRLEQRIGRVYRYGQKKKVLVFNFKTAFPIDNDILNKIEEKMENIRRVFGDNAINVIGTLLSEKDMLDLFKISRNLGTGIDKVEQLFTEKLEVLKEIDKFLIYERVDLKNIINQTNNISFRISNFDIERFFLSYISSKKFADYTQIADNKYLFNMPAIEVIGPLCFQMKIEKSNPMEFIGTFSESNDRKYIALGNEALEIALYDSMRHNRLILAYSSKKGAFATYILRFFNGAGQIIYAEPVTIIKNEDNTMMENPLWVWDLNEIEDIHSIKEDIMNVGLNYIEKIINDPSTVISSNIRIMEDFVRKKNENDLKREYDFIFFEYDWKIKAYYKKLKEHVEKGQNYLVPELQKRINELRTEFASLVMTNQKATEISWDLCGPINAGILIPFMNTPYGSSLSIEDFERLKKRIELAGMNVVMNYEKESGRIPKDVSLETWKGYDIESRSDREVRYIEVKSLARTITPSHPVIISSNEWRMSSQLSEDYYLYIIQDALSSPELPIIIRDPYKNLKSYVKTKVVEDFVVLLDVIPKQYIV